MGNSSSCDGCATAADLKAVTDEVNSLSSGSCSCDGYATTASVPDAVGFSAGGSPVSTPNINATNGWLLKSAAMTTDTPTSSTTGAQQTCPSDQVMCGISFVHKAGNNETYQESFKIECCDATLS